MKHLLWAFVGQLAVVGTAYPQVIIADINRVANRSGKLSAWCALETLARHHGISELNGVTARKMLHRMNWKRNCCVRA